MDFDLPSHMPLPSTAYDSLSFATELPQPPCGEVTRDFKRLTQAGPGNVNVSEISEISEICKIRVRMHMNVIR